MAIDRSETPKAVPQESIGTPKEKEEAVAKATFKNEPKKESSAPSVQHPKTYPSGGGGGGAVYLDYESGRYIPTRPLRDNDIYADGASYLGGYD